MVELDPQEKIEDLQCDGLRIIQSSQEYRFTTDAVLLANFCRDMQGKLCVEFCAGSGVISLLVAHKKRPRRIVAIEIQPRLADMMRRSVQLNGLQQVIEVHTADIKDASQLVSGADVVVCNPPYRRLGSGERQLQPNIALCRHEIALTLSDVVASAAAVLNNRGVFYLVHQADRLCQIVTECAHSGLAVKEILPVCPSPGKPPKLVLVRAVKGGAPDCILHKPMFVADEEGNYTQQASIWYNGQPTPPVGPKDCN